MVNIWAKHGKQWVCTRQIYKDDLDEVAYFLSRSIIFFAEWIDDEVSARTDLANKMR